MALLRSINPRLNLFTGFLKRQIRRLGIIQEEFCQKAGVPLGTFRTSLVPQTMCAGLRRATHLPGIASACQIELSIVAGEHFADRVLNDRFYRELAPHFNLESLPSAFGIASELLASGVPGGRAFAIMIRYVIERSAFSQKHWRKQISSMSDYLMAKNFPAQNALSKILTRIQQENLWNIQRQSAGIGFVARYLLDNCWLYYHKLRDQQGQGPDILNILNVARQTITQFLNQQGKPISLTEHTDLGSPNLLGIRIAKSLMNQGCQTYPYAAHFLAIDPSFLESVIEGKVRHADLFATDPHFIETLERLKHDKRHWHGTLALQVLLDHEQAQGHIPTFCSHEAKGFDILTNGPHRYIEVNGRQQLELSGRHITPREWDAASALRNDYYLAIVKEIDTSHPKVFYVRNPAARFSVKAGAGEKKYLSVSEMQETLRPYIHNLKRSPEGIWIAEIPYL